MNPTSFRYIFLQNGVGACLFNVLLNGLIGWGLVRERTELPVWGPESVVGDTVITAFLLAFLTYLIVARQARKDLACGKVEPLVLSAGLRQLLDRFPQANLPRAFMLGLVGVMCFAVPVVAWFGAIGVASMESMHFIAYKACFAGVEAAVLTPLTVILAVNGSAEPVAS
jgi:hypothetical protein